MISGLRRHEKQRLGFFFKYLTNNQGTEDRRGYTIFDDNKDSNSILRSEEPLTMDYSPQKPVGRSQEIERIAQALRPLTKRSQPENLLIYGPAGVGKTTCVEYVFDRLEEETRVKPVWINCWQHNTRSSLLTELLISLGYPATRKGTPVDELLSKLREWLDKNRGIAVALDEFDQLDDKTEVVYDLHLLNQEAENKIGVVMMSNQEPDQLQLEPRSMSRVSYGTLQFKPYTSEQLESILEERVSHALKSGSISDEVLKDIAEKVAEANGDCRQALSLALRASRKAVREGKSQVTKEDIPS